MMSLMDDSLARWVVEQARLKNWSLRKVAREAKVSQTTISDIANGLRRNLEPETCKRLAQTFGVPVEDVLRLIGILPSAIHPQDHIRQRRIVYEVQADERLLALWRGLSAEDQQTMFALLERLQAKVEPRIIGEAGQDEEGG